ncbi:MAG: flagellar hook-associated protein 3, partial [Armatimonadia bacterium]|nr:flagellar hook-associated protein 3 [Armatimonadia bacterium]
MRIRVTQELMTSTVKRNLGTSIEALFKMQDQIATQRRLARPSDDAVDFAFALNMRDALSVATRYERNSEETRDWLAVTETAVTSAGEMLQHLRTRIVQAANDTLTGEERDDLSKEVNELLEEMVSLANSDNAGRFIFAGHETLRPPLEVNRRDDGAIESVYYRGDDGRMLREIMTADVIAANVTGRELFLESAHRVTSREGTPVFDDPAGLIGDAVTQPQFVPAFTDQMISINGRAIPVLANETVNQLARRISRDPLAQVTASVEQTPTGVVPPGYRLVYNHDNANEAIAFDWVSIDEATALGTWGPGTLYINDHEITIAGADYATVAGEINTQLAALGVTDITAEVDMQTVPGLTFMRIVGPSGEQVEVTDGTSGFVAAATAGGTFLQRTGIVNGTNHIVADQEGPYNIFETLIQLRNDLEAGDDAYFLPPAELVGAGTVVDVDNTSGFISGQFQITTDAAGNVAVDYGATPPAAGVFFDPTYLAEPANETQQRQLDILNRVRVESTTIIADPNVDLSDPFHINATPPPGWTAANVPTTGTFSVNGEVFTYDGTQSLNELATLISGNPNINVTAAVTSQGHFVVVDDDGNPVDIQNGTSDVMERLGMTEPGGAETKAIALQRDSLSAFGLSLNVGAAVAGTQIVSVGP